MMFFQDINCNGLNSDHISMKKDNLVCSLQNKFLVSLTYYFIVVMNEINLILYNIYFKMNSISSYKTDLLFRHEGQDLLCSILYFLKLFDQ